MSSVITVKDMCLWYGQVQALKNININIEEKSITALIGPSGCGKSTFLKSLNRMNDLVPGVKITGDLRYRGEDIFDPKLNVNELRRNIGMVFQKPNPFPMTSMTILHTDRAPMELQAVQSLMRSWKIP